MKRMAQDPSAMRSRRRWDTSSNVAYGVPEDTQRRNQRAVPSYVAHTMPSGPHSRYRDYVSVKQDTPLPRRSSMPPGVATGYVQPVPEIPNSVDDPSTHENLQQAAYLPQRSASPEPVTQRYHNQYRTSPTRYPPRVMFEQNPQTGRNHYETGYGVDYEKTMNDQIIDPIQRSIINEAQEMVEQYDEEQVNEITPEVETYTVTPADSQSSVESGEPSGGEVVASSNLSSLERDLAKREKEERRQLHKDLKRWQKQRRKIFLRQSGEYVTQETQNYEH
ncbi:uncharacterized protein [Onthophagus taurus]|uniref:uncharacterized protein n=1 Tax=Onthophagus taurus TaxID=166361 RepID=UPI0039BE383C